MVDINYDEIPRPEHISAERWRDLIEWDRLSRVRAPFGTMRSMYSDEFVIQTESAYQALLEGISDDEISLVRQAVKDQIRRQEDQERRRRSAAIQRSRLSKKDERAWQRNHDGRIIYHERTQFAVGQGGFHVGTLTKLLPEQWQNAPPKMASAQFLYVYDCGSEPRRHVDHQIDDFISARQPAKIDLLFLSHFDRDHICGVTRLLRANAGLQVDTIVMPYLDDVERIIAFARFAAKPDTESDSWYEDMVVDPLETLRPFKPRQIVFVRSDEDGPPPEELALVGLPSGGLGPLKWEFLDETLGPGPSAWSADGNNAVVVKSGVRIQVSGDSLFWRLIPYVRRSKPEFVNTFKLVAETLLDWEAGSFSRRMSDVSVRRTVVRRDRAKLSNAYIRAFGSKNITSLSLYSGPENHDLAGAVQLEPELKEASKARVGWMGTGDAYLRDRADIRQFSDRFSADLEFVSTFVLPHHGSIENSDPGLLVSNADLWVACAEPSHAWKHPHPDLEAAVRKRDGKFSHVSSKASSALTERVIVFWQA